MVTLEVYLKLSSRRIENQLSGSQTYLKISQKSLWDNRPTDEIFKVWYVSVIF